MGRSWQRDDAEMIGSYLPRGGRDPRVRFWSFVVPNGACWEWTGARQRGGYGHFGYAAARGRTRQVGAHRLSWEMLYGAVPDGLAVCHSCDNPLCVRPSHLWLGTDQENAEDKMRKGRDNLSVRTWPKHRRGIRISFQIAEDIRRRVSMGQPRRAVASEFSVSVTLVNLIVSGKRWSDG